MRNASPACLLMLMTGCSALDRAAGGFGRFPEPPTVHCAASRGASSPLGVVFVANGAGDFRTVSRNLSQVVAEMSAPIEIRTVLWSRGYRRYLADQVDHANHLERACELAAQVIAYRQAYPERRIYLIGHSAGCAVLLAAAEMLSASNRHYVDRIILLAPSVCAAYDLRPSLRSARDGIDVFYSNEDRLVLGLGMEMVGTAERRCRVAAGETGFAPIVGCSADLVLYAKLRQHPWDPIVEWSGHTGGHFGNHEPAFLRAYVLPLLM
jgi:pimeloyl-ACP methyl ester carboxylesterase